MDLTIETTTKRIIKPIRKLLVLEAGDKIANDEEILAMAQKTVPVGYRVSVIVDIKVVKIEEI